MLIPRKNRHLNDEISVEKTLLDLETQYGGTEAGRLAFVSLQLSNICESHMNDFCVTFSFAREYLKQLVASQKGRPHPSKEFRKNDQMRLYKVFEKVNHQRAPAYLSLL